MYSCDTKIRVRYAETDQMGYVYHGNYAAFFEVSRTEAFRQLGISYKDLEASGVGMPVGEIRTRFRRPARYACSCVSPWKARGFYSSMKSITRPKSC